MPTPLHPTFRTRIDDAFEHLIQQQVTPWLFVTAGPPFRIKKFNGKEIAYQGVGFEGSPREVFWSRYIEPFLEHLCASEIETAVLMAREKSVDARLLLLELHGLLSSGFRKVYEHMAGIDRSLRGKGYPKVWRLGPSRMKSKAWTNSLMNGFWPKEKKGVRNRSATEFIVDNSINGSCHHFLV